MMSLYNVLLLCLIQISNNLYLFCLFKALKNLPKEVGIGIEPIYRNAFTKAKNGIEPLCSAKRFHQIDAMKRANSTLRLIASVMWSTPQFCYQLLLQVIASMLNTSR